MPMGVEGCHITSEGLCRDCWHVVTAAEKRGLLAVFDEVFINPASTCRYCAMPIEWNERPYLWVHCGHKATACTRPVMENWPSRGKFRFAHPPLLTDALWLCARSLHEKF